MTASDELELTYYVNTDFFRREGNVVKWWGLFDYKTTHTDDHGVSFMSMTMQMESDCSEGSDRLLLLTEFSDHMGMGKRVFGNSYVEKWQPIQPGSRGHTIWKFVCTKK